MRQLDNYLVTLAMTVQKLGVPLRDDGWPVVSIKGSAVAFHCGRFIYHVTRLGKPVNKEGKVSDADGL